MFIGESRGEAGDDYLICGGGRWRAAAAGGGAEDSFVFFYVLPADSHAPSGQGDLETDFITSKDSLHGENWPSAAGPNP